MCKINRVKRPQTATEAKMAMLLQQSMKVDGRVVLEFLLLQTSESWKDFQNEKQTATMRKELIPIAARALRPFGLAREDHIEDLVQRLYFKLIEGAYFKKYRAGQALPKTYIMGSAVNLAKTIARSIWRSHRRNVTNMDWTKA